MFYTKIKHIWDLFYVNPEEIADSENAQEIINQYSGNQKIPIRILVIGDRENGCVVIAGEGAMYPWKVGQRVEVGGAYSYIRHLDYLHELCIKGVDNSPYQDFILFESIKPIEQGEYFLNNDALAYNGISSFKIYTGLAKHIVFKDEVYYKQIKRRSKMKHLTRSVELPQDNQWGENWEWETSYQCYEVDAEFKDKSYFEQMDDEEKICLIRKMENFIEERGVSIAFARNYAKLDHVFHGLDEPKNRNIEERNSNDWLT